jgi:hypothetical protein
MVFSPYGCLRRFWRTCTGVTVAKKKPPNYKELDGYRFE